MGVFLFLKQIVDILYEWKFLDYLMVIFALGLLVRGLLTEKNYATIWKKLIFADYVVFGLILLFSLALIRNVNYYANFFKIMSAFILYFLGRVYGGQVFSYGRILAGLSYLIIYANLVKRFIQFGCRLTVGIGEEGLLNSGGFYYYKTDLAVALLIGIIFIYNYSEVILLKWITIFPIVGYMIFYSGARMEMAVLVFIYALMVSHMICKKSGKKVLWVGERSKLISILLFSICIVMLLVIQLLPYEKYQIVVTNDAGNASLMDKIFHSRHVIWWNILHYFTDQPILTRLLGIDLGTDYLHGVAGDRSHSLYVKQIYAVGYLGWIWLGLFIVCLVKKIGNAQSRKCAYVTLSFWVLFLLAGVSIETLELTQMSWFPMIFAGALFSSPSVEEKA